MAQFFLVRHGARLSMTDPNSPLSAEGEAQAKALAKRFKDIGLTKMYVSTATRAIETAKPIHVHHEDIPLLSTDALTEVHASLVGGKRGEDIPRSRRDRKRADRAFDDLFSQAKKHDRILIVCHGNIIRYFIAKALRTPKADLWHGLHLDSASITILEGHKDTWAIKTINAIDHLPERYRKEFYRREHVRN